MRVKADLGAFYAIITGNGFSLLYSSHGTHEANNSHKYKTMKPTSKDDMTMAYHCEKTKKNL